jgi:uncharacterized protein DUF1918
MHAQPGDWLIVEQAGLDHEARRGLIEDVRSPDGTPPYLVRWLDTGQEALVFPGPDAHVRTPEELELAGSRAAGRAAEVQRQIRSHRRLR